MRLVLATRSADKAREIGEILRPGHDLEILSLDQLGIPPTDEEDDVEAYDTFARNALAKATFFARKTRLPTLADDSGLVVDALGGEPGVRSKRFAPGDDLTGRDRDRANNDFLLERLQDVPSHARTARYMCAAVLVSPNRSRRTIALGTCEGEITRKPRGEHGFGYDPLFLVPTLGLTFAQIPRAQKNRRSHRSRAFRAIAPLLRNSLAI